MYYKDYVDRYRQCYTHTSNFLEACEIKEVHVIMTNGGGPTIYLTFQTGDFTEIIP